MGRRRRRPRVHRSYNDRAGDPIDRQHRAPAWQRPARRRPTHGQPRRGSRPRSSARSTSSTPTSSRLEEIENSVSSRRDRPRRRGRRRSSTPQRCTPAPTPWAYAPVVRRAASAARRAGRDPQRRSSTSPPPSSLVGTVAMLLDTESAPRPSPTPASRWPRPSSRRARRRDAVPGRGQPLQVQGLRPSPTAGNTDNGDGQGAFNGDRVRQADGAGDLRQRVRGDARHRPRSSWPVTSTPTPSRTRCRS